MNSKGKRCEVCQGESFRKLYTKNNFNILKCDTCGLVFTDVPENLNLLDIYDESYFEGGQDDGYADYLASEKVLRSEFRKSVKLISKLQPSKRGLKLLEIGSAYGFFLDEASPYYACTGIEVSKSGVEFSRKRGHTVIHGIADEMTLRKLGNFDVIVMLDVIEHLPSPLETIKLLRDHLNTNGIMLIVTGDVSSFLSRITGKFWRLMTPPQHTFFFSGSTLTRLLHQSGLSILQIDKPWKFVPLGLALYQLTARLGMKSKWVDKFNTFGVYANLFDTVRIVAKK